MPEKTATVRSVSELAPRVLLLDLAMTDPAEIAYRAGQFVSLRLDATGELRRSYSIASYSSRRDGLELLVKLVEGGAGAAFFAGVRPGDEVHFTGPMGFFTNELAHAGDVVHAATGSGIAAALPMIEEVLRRPAELEHGRVLLYWGLRSEADVFWQDRLEALAARSERFAYHICLSRPSPGWRGVNGRITRHVLDAVGTLARPVLYLVGNGAMIHELRDLLLARGIDRKRQIRTEVFYPGSES